MASFLLPSTYFAQFSLIFQPKPSNFNVYQIMRNHKNTLLLLKLLSFEVCTIDRITEVFSCDTAKALELISLAQFMGANLVENSCDSAAPTYSLKNWEKISLPVGVYLEHYESVAQIEEFEDMPIDRLHDFLIEVGSD